MLLALQPFASEAKNRINLKGDAFSIVVPDAECSQVKLAVASLQRDFEKVMNCRPTLCNQLASGKTPQLVIVNDETEASKRLLSGEKTMGGFESHRVYADGRNNRIYLRGKDIFANTCQRIV